EGGVGARFQQRLGEWSWSVSGRYEANRADSMRYHYNGPMLGVGLTNPMPGGGRLESAVRYRIRQFIARRVTIGTTEVLRRDSDWVATVAWHQLVGRWEIVYSYRYERYRSNDARREFREH